MDTSVDPATLTVMMGKFDQALESLSTISNNVSRILDFLLKLPDNQISTQLSTANEGTSQDNSTQNTTQNTTQQLCESIKELINETCQPKIDKEATKIKTSLINIWDKNLSNRRNQFWLQIRNENTAKVYEEWRDKTPIILPQKLQMYPINGEPEDQTSRRERQVLDNFRTERDLLNLRAESNRESYIRIDEEMLALISEKASGRTKEKLLEMWRNDTKQQETISIRRWDNKNKVWLEKYASEFTTKHADKNPFIRQDTRNPASYEPTRGQNRPTTSNNRGWNSNTRQYRSTDAQQQSYANAVQQNIRQFSRNQDGNEPRTDTNVTYIGQRFNNQRRDEQPNSFNTGRQRTNVTRGRTYGQNRPTPSQRQHTPYADNGNTSRQRPYQRNINQNYFLDKEEELMIET